MHSRGKCIHGVFKLLTACQLLVRACSNSYCLHQFTKLFFSYPHIIHTKHGKRASSESQKSFLIWLFPWTQNKTCVDLDVQSLKISRFNIQAERFYRQMHPHLNEWEPFFATLRWLMRGSGACRVPSCSRGDVQLRSSAPACRTAAWQAALALGWPLHPPGCPHSLTSLTWQEQPNKLRASWSSQLFHGNIFPLIPSLILLCDPHKHTSMCKHRPLRMSESAFVCEQKFCQSRTDTFDPCGESETKNRSCKAYCRGQELPAQIPPLTDPLTCVTILQGIIPVYIGTFVLKRPGHISRHIWSVRYLLKKPMATFFFTVQQIFWPVLAEHQDKREVVLVK